MSRAAPPIDSKTHRKVQAKKQQFVTLLLQWSRTVKQDYPWRNTTNPYHILVAELLLRKTRADQVKPVYRVFLKKYPSLKELSEASRTEIQETVQSLGLKYRSQWICEISKNLTAGYQDGLSSDFGTILNALGEGKRYTTSAIRCFALGEDIGVFDVNVKRILERVFSIDLGKNAHKRRTSWALSNLLVPSGRAKEYNWALIDLGRLVCTARNPKCQACPLSKICDFATNDAVPHKRPLQVSS